MALAEHGGHTGRKLTDALVLGVDVACRVRNAVYPEHHDRGWHITGSTGTLGAAAACARLPKLDAHRTAMALGIAASQPIGMREQFGTMTKPFHPGAAAQAGLLSALHRRAPGEDECADAGVRRNDWVALRHKVVATVDDAIDEAARRNHACAMRRSSGYTAWNRPSSAPWSPTRCGAAAGTAPGPRRGRRRRATTGSSSARRTGAAVPRACGQGVVDRLRRKAAVAARSAASEK